MKEFTYTIKEPVGIHARPAGMLAKEAKTCQSTVTIVDKNGKSVDATRLMALMGMGIKCGDTVTVKLGVVGAIYDDIWKPAQEALKAEGVELLYHNHNCELRHVNAEKRAYDILLEETDPQFVNFEFDSYWFTEGGANALAWMQRLGTRMKLWHINDRGTRISGSAVTPILKTDSMELGTGNMDLDSLMAQALSVGVDAVILESHRNWVDNSPIKSLQVSAEYLKKHT